MPKKQLFFAAAIFILSLFILGASLWYLPRSAVHQAVENFESRVGKLDITTYAPAPLPDDQNAAHWLMLGSPALFQPEAPFEVYAEHFALLTRAVSLPSDLGIDYERGFEAPLPDLGRLLQGMKVLEAALRGAIEEGDRERALLAFRTLGALRGAFFREPIVVAQILGLAVDEKYLDAFVSLQEAGFLDADSRAEALRELDPQERERQFSAAVAGEAAVVLAMPAVGDPSMAEELFASLEKASLLNFFSRLPEAARLPPHEVEAFLAQDPSFIAEIAAEIGWLTRMTAPNLIEPARKEAAARERRERLRGE